MAGGTRDSSLTRVQPVFRALYAKGPSGPWLHPLILLGSRIGVIPRPSTCGHLLQPPIYEFSASPPFEYLNHLLGATARLKEAAAGNPSPYANRSEYTNQRRRGLVKGNPEVIAGGRRQLQIDATVKKWWVLEGPTMVDCALFAEDVTVFIEGKRTEQHLTGSISWDPMRHQVFRNLDCLAAMPEHARKRAFYVLLIVDRDEVSACLDEARGLDTPAGEAIAHASWPHLNVHQAASLFEHYLGYTTWQDVRNAFNLSPLPEDTTEGLTWPKPKHQLKNL